MAENNTISLSEKRKGEIALRVLEVLAQKKDILPHIQRPEETKKELSRMAKDTGVPEEELKLFIKSFITNLLSKALD